MKARIAANWPDDNRVYQARRRLRRSQQDAFGYYVSVKAETVFLHSLPTFLSYYARANQHIVLQGNISGEHTDISAQRPALFSNHNQYVYIRPAGAVPTSF
jgi:hypothetical protein